MEQKHDTRLHVVRDVYVKRTKKGRRNEKRTKEGNTLLLAP